MLEYDVNLDIMESSNRLSSEYIAVEFNEGEKKLLNTLESVEVSYPGNDYTAVEGRYLASGTLDANESVSYSLKLWMDESVTVSDDAMNKSFISKVVVTAKQSHKVRLVDLAQLGDYIEMTPTSTSYTIPSSMTGYSSDQTINPSELNLWRVIKKNDDGTMEIVSEYVSSTTVYLSGVTGWNNLVATLQEIASQYENKNFTVGSRHFGYNSQTYHTPTSSLSICGTNYGPGTYNASLEPKGCGDIDQGGYNDRNLLLKVLGTSVGKSVLTGTAKSYWNCSRFFASSSTTWVDYIKYVNTNGVVISDGYDGGGYLYTSSNESKTKGYSVRPMLIISVDVLYEGEMGDGSLEKPFILNSNE